MEDFIDKILSKIKEISVRYKYIILGTMLVSIGIYIVDYIKVDEKQEIDISQYYGNAQDIQEENKMIIVHIDGAVNNPGVYEIPTKSRINDVITIAGGLTQEAITTNINLARKVNDGEKIYVYRIGEEEIAIVDNQEKSGKVNINNATKEELLALPGIGSSTAIKIMEYVKENGDFKSIEDIKNVNGIGESKFANIKDLIDIK